MFKLIRIESEERNQPTKEMEGVFVYSASFLPSFLPFLALALILILILVLLALAVLEIVVPTQLFLLVPIRQAL